MTTTCQHTGLTFEARSKAAKNHPAVSDLLAEANKRGAYRETIDAIREVREALGEDLTLEAVEAAARAAISGRREELQAQRDLWRQRRDERRERLNAYARGTAPGRVDEEDADRESQGAVYSEADSDARYDEV
jgi:hypothetical protein